METEDTPDGERVTVKTQKMSPIPTDIMVRERARARAIVGAGIAETTSEVFTGPYELTRLTSVESMRTTDRDFPPTKEFVVMVRQ